MSVCVCVRLRDRFIMFVICAGLVERMLGPFLIVCFCTYFS